MEIRSFTFNPFSTNCFVCHDAGEAVVVDPSCRSAEEVEAVVRYLADERLQVSRILLTHAHIDHIFGCRALHDRLGVGIWVHREDAPLLGAAVRQGEMFGVPVEPPPEPAGYLADGDTLVIGGASWQVLHTPGHSPGSVSFADAAHRFVLSGDVLFRDSIGRTDLWMGSLGTLMRSIFDRLVPLGDDVTVWCGHGPSTTIGRERASNPFLTGR